MSKGIRVEKMRLVSWQYTKAIFTTVIKLAEGEEIFVNDCQVNDGKNGLYVRMPQRSYEKDGEKKYANVVFIQGERTLNAITDAAMTEYRRLSGNSGSKPVDNNDDFPF